MTDQFSREFSFSLLWLGNVSHIPHLGLVSIFSHFGGRVEILVHV